MHTAATQAQIVKTPGVCGGRARIDGHRIRVQDIVIEYEWQGLSPEEICREHPGLTLAQVHTALAYYFEHRDEIQAEIRTDEALVANLKRQQGQACQDAGSGRTGWSPPDRDHR